MISYSDNTLTIDGREHHLNFPIESAVESGDRVFVLFDPDAHHEKFGQFENVVALSRAGEVLWIAELPTSRSGDRYYRLVCERALKASSVFSFVCELDPATGRILRKEFLK